MKNQLIPILLPTEDASLMILYEDKLFYDDGGFDYHTTNPMHLYFCSSEKPKEGDWYVFNWCGQHIQKCEDVEWEKDIDERCKKIIFTTDPLLIADGVPAIDGNTIAVYWIGTDDIYFTIQVNFLEEFCKRWNDKRDIVIECEMEEATLIFK